jgi:hypothetical protein
VERFEPRVLQAAIRAARRSLRDLEEDQIPASTRPVAASAARHLPPPLANALVRDLDRFAWMRDKAVEAWPEIEEAAGDDAASAAFLLRSEGWEKIVEKATAERSGRDLGRTVERLTNRVRDLEHELGVERERADKARAEKAKAEHRVRRQSQEIDQKLQEARQAERVSRLAAESRVASLRRDLDEALADLSEADDRVSFLREELLRARRAAHAQPVARPPDAWSSRDPAVLASLLDQIVASARPEAVPATGPRTEAPQERLTLPLGVRPDTAGAVDWLLDQDDPFVMIVDGYNLSHQWATPLTREDLNHRLARIRRLAIAPARVVVVYDSTLSGGGQDGPGPGGIEVRFTDEGALADDEIVDMARTLSGNVVVVSSDREVRERADEALCLWSQALREWLRR